MDWHKSYSCARAKGSSTIMLVTTTCKHCARCKSDKPLAEFGYDRTRSDGRCVTCRECVRVASRARYAANIGTERAKSAERQRRWRVANPERAQAVSRAWDAANREKKRASWRRWHEANKDTARQRGRERQRQLRQENPEAVRATKKQWRAANKERVKITDRASRLRNATGQKAIQKRWRERNPDRHRELNRRWHAANLETVRLQKRATELVRRAKKAAVFVERVDAATVFERDRGVCGICHLSVDRDGQWHVDHIVPISKGGAHSYANVQLAHGRCNCSKGNKLVAA